MKMLLMPNMYKIMSLWMANAKEIVNSQMHVWHQICTKPLLWRHMLMISLLENAFEAKYVQNRYFEWQMLMISLLYKCIWHLTCTNSLLWRQMLRKSFTVKIHLATHMCKTVTLQANGKEIITYKCIWHQICTKLLLWRQMLRKSSL